MSPPPLPLTNAPSAATDGAFHFTESKWRIAAVAGLRLQRCFGVDRVRGGLLHRVAASTIQLLLATAVAFPQLQPHSVLRFGARAWCGAIFAESSGTRKSIWFPPQSKNGPLEIT
jgi:hypothetical protein